MRNKSLLLRLLAGASFVFTAAPSFAQAAGDETAASLTSQEVAARATLLEQQVKLLQQELETLKKQAGAATPSWKGAPQFVDKERGWSFKPRGRIQFDAAYIENPNDAVPTRNLGFNTRVRRIRLGAEGSIPGGFGYKFEMDFANGRVGFGDAILTYAPADQPWSVTVGNHEPFEGLEQLTSSLFTSFVERAQMNDAFGHSRRLGVSFGLTGAEGKARFNAGLFAGHGIDASFDNEGWIGAARATYSPEALGGILHFGANYQHREFQSNNGGTSSNSAGAPSNRQLARYRARPFLQTTDVRFVDTGAFAARSDDIVGAELAGIFGPLHLASEAQYTRVNAYQRGDIATGLDAFSSANTGFVPSGDPSFFSWYGEAGYFLTGETRGYRNGTWNRTKVLRPFSKGGWGALQLNGRYDHLDLGTRKLQQGFTNNFTTGASAPTTALGRGGTQAGYQASLIWIPEDYVRFLLQYTRTEVEGGPLAATVVPGSSDPLDERNYGVNSVAVRAQVDF